MGLTLLLLLVVCPVVMFLMVRGMGGGHEHHAQPRAPSALEILEARYARDEITWKEYEQIRETLARSAGAPVA